jgi:hypothetical protein
MKRILAFAPVCLVLAALLVGCDDDAANGTSDTATPPEAATTEGAPTEELTPPVETTEDASTETKPAEE